LTGGERIEDSRLNVEVAGMMLENPVMVGAGWDKKGRCVDGLYNLGFAGTEVGSVLVFPQAGNPKPRLFTDSSHSVGLNRLGFNSPGVDAVEAYLSTLERHGIVGISAGKNKLLADEMAAWAHAEVVSKLYDYGDYFVINVSSPNTPGLRNFLESDKIRDIIIAVKEVLMDKGGKPLFVKTTIDLSEEDMYELLQVLIDEGVDGIIDSNTTVDKSVKAKYGWQNEAGGLSGNDSEFRERANDRMKFITSETRNTGLQRIGNGAINSSAAAIERIEAGAQAIQVVTAIRQHGLKTPRMINHGILQHLDKHNIKNLEEITGIAA
jgi:dihydroorotate dehydrogenase